MPRITSFELTSFKGIERISIDLVDRTDCPVITLIGLNESGKTTVLEGISNFVSVDDTSSLFEGVYTKSSSTGLMPIHKKANFTGDIQIQATVVLDDEDVIKAQKIAKQFNVRLNEEKIKEPFTITKKIRYEDSAYKKTLNIWGIQIFVTAQRAGSKEKEYVRPNSGKPDLWKEIVAQVGQDLPKISYFPTFLVDMPARIYLQEYDEEKAVNRYYRKVMQDILDSLGEGLDLKKHVSDRIEEFQKSESSPNWLSILFGGASKGPIDSVFQKISSAVTREVLGSWQKVFQRAISAKSIFVEWNVDTQNDNLPYASFYVSDGESRYAISERSLGFRWFFSFLLFTAFKQAKEQNVIFIFDEPAANLHAKAQAELLKSFSRIASDGNKIMYSTHSHHMVNPQWLSGAYIVENTALDYDKDDAFDLSTKPTNVTLKKYRDFVSQYPTRSSYFQPVIEKLEYVTPEILGNSPYVMVEGITDYYALKLAAQAKKLKLKFSLMPGSGAGACGPQIGLLMGRGERFLIVLDDDGAGKKSAVKYREDWYLESSTVFTLADIDEKFRGAQLESLILQDSEALIKKNCGLSTKPTKKQIGWYLSEAYAQENNEALSDSTLVTLARILKELDSKIS